MNVAVYPSNESVTPFIRVMSGGLDDVETAAEKYLTPLGISYQIVESSTITPSPYIANSQTVTLGVDGAPPTYGWDFAAAQQAATAYNSEYWQKQYNQGILGLSITAPYQLSLAIATPEAERTAEQLAAVEFLTGINTLQTEVQDSIDAATTGEEIIQILSQLG
jgi:hypothetical protein